MLWVWWEVLAIPKMAPARKVAARQNRYSGETGRFYSVAGKPFVEEPVMFRQGLVFALAFGLLAISILAQPEAGKRTELEVGKRCGPEVNPCFLSVNAIGPVIPGEPTRLEACIRSEWALDTLTVVFTPVGAIQYSGQTEWRQVVNAGDSIVYNLEVIYPRNDTAGFELVGYKNGLDFIGSGFYVVSTRDSVKTFKTDPRKLLVGAGEPYSKEYLEVLRNSPPQAGMDSTTKVKISTHKLTDWERMKMKERTPLAGDTMEVIEVDGKPWIRHPGESEFQPLPVITNRDSAMAAQREQLLEKRLRTDFDVIIDLRDSSAHALVRDTLGWSLQPTDSAGFYLTTQSGKALTNLESRGILYSQYPRYPRPMQYRTPDQQRVYDSIHEEKRLKSLQRSGKSEESKHQPR
jgi:hypothetical protein